MTTTEIRLEANSEAALAHDIVTEAAASVADPAPLGLAGFALTTFVLSAVNAGVVHKGVEPVVFGLALAYGGAAQLLAGMWEFKKGNTFGATAFSSYGAFWISFWALVTFFAKQIPKADVPHAVGLYLFAWGVFTLLMLIASFRTNVAVNIVFILLTITFFLLAAGNWGSNTNMVKLGGWFGIATAVAAWYAALAGVLKFTFGKEMLPNPPLKR